MISTKILSQGTNPHSNYGGTETVNTRNMGRGEQLPHATHSTSYQPHIMPYVNNQRIVPNISPYNNYGAGTHTPGLL